MDPAWASCDSDPYGGHFAFVFDPPRALSPRTAKVPSPTTILDTRPSASPVPLLSSPGPAQTLSPPSSSPTVDPPGKGPLGSGGDPSSGNPSNGSPSNGSPNNGNPSNGSPSNDSPGAGDPEKGGSGPANPNEETPAQLSALRQALGLAPSANPQPRPAAQSNEATQPEADPKASASAPANSPANSGGSSGAGSGISDSGGHNSGDPKVNDSNNGGSSGSDQSSLKALVDGQSPATAPSFTIPILVGPNLLGTVVNSGSVVIGGATIEAGATAAQVSNHQVSLGAEASNIVIDGQSHVLPSPNPQDIHTYPPPPASIFTVGGQIISLSSENIIVAGSTLKANDPAFTVPGKVVSLDSSALNIGTSSKALILPTPPTAAPRVITAAGQLATILSNGAAIAGATLTSNGPAITVSGTPLSLGASALIVGTSTIPLPTLPPASALTVAGDVVTPILNGVVIAGTTLTPDAPQVTIAGTPVSLGASGLLVGTSTIPYQSIGSSSSGGAIDGFVFSGINGGFATPAVSGVGKGNGAQAETFIGGEWAKGWVEQSGDNDRIDGGICVAAVRCTLVEVA